VKYASFGMKCLGWGKFVAEVLVDEK